MKTIINKKNFTVQKVEKSDFDEFLREDLRETHPDNLIKKTFPERVMKIISSDHHKSRDGSFSISYDYWDEKWYITHDGYIREVKVEGDSFLSVAKKYLSEIRRENDKVLYRGIEEETNKKLPKDISIEISDDEICVYNYSKGINDFKCLSSYDIKGKSVGEVIDEVNRILSDKY